MTRAPQVTLLEAMRLVEAAEQALDRACHQLGALRFQNGSVFLSDYNYLFDRSSQMHEQLENLWLRLDVARRNGR